MDTREKKIFAEAMTIEEQISNLKDLQLIIEDEENAKDYLSKVSYYRLIKAYSLGLKTRNSCYHESVTFEKIVRIYEFNTQLRQILFPVVEHIEVTLRCVIVNYFCTKYGNLGYLDKNNFENETFFFNFFHDLEIEVTRNKKTPFVKNFVENYQNGDLPLYAAVEIFSFGMLSKFYSNMKIHDQKAIAKIYNIGYTYFRNWIHCISNLRNICAHYGRIYNNNNTTIPKLYKEDKEVADERSLFALLLIIKRTVKKDLVWDEFFVRLERCIILFENHIHLDKIGFSENWNEFLKPRIPVVA